MRSVHHRRLLAVSVVVVLAAMLPVSAEAQRGRGGGGTGPGGSASAGSGSGVRRGPGPQGAGPTRVVYGGGGHYRYPYYRPYYYRPYYPYYYSPYYYGFYGYPFYASFGFGWGWGAPYPYYHPPYGYGYYDGSSAVHIDVKQQAAEVYVDGYLAGKVDDFDGWLQRLHLSPGGHEIVIRLEGFRVLRHRLMLRPGTTHTIRGVLQPLANGETMEPVPVPTEPPDPPQGADPQRPYPDRTAPADPDRDRIRVESAFGAVAIRVQPKDAQILIDGELWRGAEGVDRLVVQLSVGTHRIEVRMDGRQPFSTAVEIRKDETTTLNVSLPPQNDYADSIHPQITQITQVGLRR